MARGYRIGLNWSQRSDAWLEWFDLIRLVKEDGRADLIAKFEPSKRAATRAIIAATTELRAVWQAQRTI